MSFLQVSANRVYKKVSRVAIYTLNKMMFNTFRMELVHMFSLHFLTKCLPKMNCQLNSGIVSAARSLTCRDDLDSKWRLLLAENELSRVSLLSRISIEN